MANLKVTARLAPGKPYQTENAPPTIERRQFGYELGLIASPRRRRKSAFEPEVGGGAAALMEAIEKLTADVSRAFVGESLELLGRGYEADTQATQF